MSAKALRYTLFWGRTLFLLVIPIFFVANTFDLFHREGFSLARLTITGLISLILAMHYFKKHFEKWIESLPFSLGKAILGYLITLTPFLIIYIVVRYAQIQTELMQALMFRIIISAMIGAAIGEIHLYFKEVDTETKRFKKWGS